MTKTTIKDKRRQRRNKLKITSNDELYTSSNEIFEIDETPEYVEQIQVKSIERKRFRPLIGAEYDYKEMAEKYS